MTEMVVMTASAGTFPGVIAALEAASVRIEERPLLRFTPPADWGPLDAALEKIGTYGAVGFTSPRAVESLLERMRVSGIPWPAGRGIPGVWAGGSGTAAALGSRVGQVHTPPGDDTARLGSGAALARAMLAAGVSGPVLFPCGERRRDELPRLLRDAGVKVDEVVCYRTVMAAEAEARAAVEWATVLVVSSPSVAELVARSSLPDARPDLVAVGPTTAASARAAGWPPAAVASEPSAEAVTTAVLGVLASRCSHE